MTTTTNKSTSTTSTSTETPVKTPSEYIAQFGNKSKAIRALLAQGMTRGQVAKALNIRYQHVRNVDITPVKNQTAQ